MKQLEGTKEREWVKSCGTESHTIKTFTGTPDVCYKKIKEEGNWICATMIRNDPHEGPLMIPLLWQEVNFYYFSGTAFQTISASPGTVKITIYGLTNF